MLKRGNENRDKAARALRLTRVYRAIVGDLISGDTETALADMLGDFRHLCDHLGLAFHDLDERAHGYYSDEAEDERIKARAEEGDDADADTCEPCEGRGWLEIDSATRGPEIQRCDTCGKYDTDDDARAAADWEASSKP